MKIGIIREGKQPPDRRAPFSPGQCREIVRRFPGTEVVVQSSRIRCFSDEEYLSAGISVVEDLSDCDILMGVKEVPVDQLIAGKTYFFFSHTIKKQAYNRTLLQEIVRKKIRLVDYETLTSPDGARIIGFGRFAGLAGAYNGLLTFGKRNRLFDLKPAHCCENLQELMANVKGLRLPPLKIAVTGDGRVAGGVLELFQQVPLRRVSVDDYLKTDSFNEPVFVQLLPGDYNSHKAGKMFDLFHFFNHPEEYAGNFVRFCSCTDLLIAAAYWDPKAPVLFSPEDLKTPDFRIRVIADITCDIDGSVPSTKMASSIENPVYDYNPRTGRIEPAFSSEENIAVMAVDNLPCELPNDASLDFGRNLIEKVLPGLLENDRDEIIERATITKEGLLTRRFSYLSDFLGKTED